MYRGCVLRMHQIYSLTAVRGTPSSHFIAESIHQPAQQLNVCKQRGLLF